jgi:hypothetical protein
MDSIADPVNIMAPYQQNNTCTPFLASRADATCTLGNMASYAINVSGAASVQAGVKFARKHNLRLLVKNTGHDHLGRASGRGALALWTHNLKSKALVDYRSSFYTGPALRLGSGVQVQELSVFAGAHGLRAVSGSKSLTFFANWNEFAETVQIAFRLVLLVASLRAQAATVR